MTVLLRLIGSQRLHTRPVVIKNVLRKMVKNQQFESNDRRRNIVRRIKFISLGVNIIPLSFDMRTNIEKRTEIHILVCQKRLGFYKSKWSSYISYTFL